MRQGRHTNFQHRWRAAVVAGDAFDLQGTVAGIQAYLAEVGRQAEGTDGDQADGVARDPTRGHGFNRQGVIARTAEGQRYALILSQTLQHHGISGAHRFHRGDASFGQQGQALTHRQAVDGGCGEQQFGVVVNDLHGYRQGLALGIEQLEQGVVGRVQVDGFVKARHHLHAAIYLTVENAVGRVEATQLQQYIRHHLQQATLSINAAGVSGVITGHHTFHRTAGGHAATGHRFQWVGHVDHQHALVATGDIEGVAVEVDVVDEADVINPRHHAWGAWIE